MSRLTKLDLYRLARTTSAKCVLFFSFGLFVPSVAHADKSYYEYPSTTQAESDAEPEPHTLRYAVGGIVLTLGVVMLGLYLVSRHQPSRPDSDDWEG